MNQQTIRIGIVGYGNLGRGAELAIAQNTDMSLVGVFTRRDPSTIVTINPTVNVYTLDALDTMQEDIDVLLLCGGSATDLPEMTPYYAKHYHVVDSFDTHAKIPEHFARINAVAQKSGKVAVISVGWDPGLFSLHRAMAEAVLPQGTSYTFWGKGISQGHSDAIRHVAGVADARQYTIPSESALSKVRSGETPTLATRDKHARLCYVVPKEGADLEKVRNAIVTMPDYFADYDTTVHFITAKELEQEHSGLPHGGLVIRSGKTGDSSFQQNNQIIEYQLQLDSNPEFTASVLTAYARAAVRLGRDGYCGCKTIFDIPPAYLLDMSREDMRKNLL